MTEDSKPILGELEELGCLELYPLFSVNLGWRVKSLFLVGLHQLLEEFVKRSR